MAAAAAQAKGSVFGVMSAEAQGKAVPLSHDDRTLWQGDPVLHNSRTAVKGGRDRR